MDLFYKRYGTEGPPLLILHGLLGASGNWHTLSRTVFQNEARVFALDQRNHGRSPHADAFDYPTLAEDLHAFIDQQALRPATVMGHSMGGKTAMQAALTYPDDIDRLIVVDMAPRGYPPRHAELLDALAAIDPSIYDRRSDIDAALADDVPSRPIRQFLLKNLQHDGEQYTWQMNLDAIRANYEAIMAPIDSTATFDGPTLFIRGEHSDYVTDDDRPGIRDRFPQANLVTIPGADHWVHADAPDAFAETVVDFLSESSR